MTDLSAVATLIDRDRIPQALDLCRAAQPDVDVSVIFGALSNGGFQDAGIALLKWEASRPEGAANLDLLKFLTTLLYNLKRYEEAEPFAETLYRHEPGFGHWYTIRAWARNAACDPKGVAGVIAEAQEQVTPAGIDFQPSKPPDMSAVKAELEHALVKRRRDYLAKVESGQASAETAVERKRRKRKRSAKADLRAKTGNATEIGATGAILSGRITGASAPGTYCFRYGDSKDGLDHQTPWKPLPPGARSEIRAPVLETANQWKVCAVEHKVDFAEGGVRLRAPFGKDRNHLSGVGVADLLGAWLNSLAAQGGATRGRRARGPDLRDAEIILRVRTENLDSGDFLFTFNTQAKFARNGESFSAPWTLSARPVDFGVLADGEWQDIAATFSANPEDWSFCGNNPDEQGEYARYSYGPLGTVLAGWAGAARRTVRGAGRSGTPGGLRHGPRAQ